MVVGHADELGFQVNYISKEGFIYLVGIGGFDPSLARGQRVLIHGRNKVVEGVIGSMAHHLRDKDKGSKLPEIHELFVDVGASSGDEVLQDVAIGDPVTYKVGYDVLREDVWTARGCDNRIGIFCAAEILRICRHAGPIQPCVIAASSVQEENGAFGAAMLGYSVRPDASLVIDVGHATDVPFYDPKRVGDIKLGQGPIVSRGSVNHPVIVERLRVIAERDGIPIQWATDPRWSGTDADTIFVQRGGIPSAVISLPNRYMHTPVEIIHLRDMARINQLLSAFLVDLKSGERFDFGLT
jgi:endoglucanase